jgi:hypothetical protein
LLDIFQRQFAKYIQQAEAVVIERKKKKKKKKKKKG